MISPYAKFKRWVLHLSGWRQYRVALSVEMDSTQILAEGVTHRVTLEA